MPRKSFLLLLTTIGCLLILPPLMKADSIDISPFDSGQSFTLYGSDWRGFFVLTPTSTVHVFDGELWFAASIPDGWAVGSGTVTFNFSILGGPSISGVPGFGVGPLCPPNIPCVSFGIVGNFNPSPATLTINFSGANGGTETAHFLVSNITPEPSTLLLFGTGVVLFGALYRYRMRSAGRIV